MYTIENIFEKFKLGNKEVFEIEFKNGTECFSKFGKTIVLFVEFSDEELFDIIKNIREKKETNNFELKGKLIDSMEVITIRIDEAERITRHK